MPFSMTVPGQNCGCCQQKGPDCDPCMKCYPRAICTRIELEYNEGLDCEICCTVVHGELRGGRIAGLLTAPEQLQGIDLDLDPEFYIEDYKDRFACVAQKDVIRTTDELIHLRRCESVVWSDSFTCGDVILDISSGVMYLDNQQGLTGCYYVVLIAGVGYYFSKMSDTPSGSDCEIPTVSIIINDYDYCVKKITVDLKIRDRQKNPFFGYCDAPCVHCGCIPNSFCWEYWRIDKTSIDYIPGNTDCDGATEVYDRGRAIFVEGIAIVQAGDGYDEISIAFSINPKNCYFTANGIDLFSIDSGLAGEAIKCGFPQSTTNYILFEDEDTIEIVSIRESPCEIDCFEPECAGHCPAFFDCSTYVLNAVFSSDCEYWDGHTQPISSNQSNIVYPYTEGVGCAAGGNKAAFWGYTIDEWVLGEGDACVVFCHDANGSSVEGAYDVGVECYGLGGYNIRFSLRLYYPANECEGGGYINCANYLLDIRVDIIEFPYNCEDIIFHKAIPVSSCSCSPVMFEFALPDDLVAFAALPSGPDECCALLCASDSGNSIRFTV